MAESELNLLRIQSQGMFDNQKVSPNVFDQFRNHSNFNSQANNGSNMHCGYSCNNRWFNTNHQFDNPNATANQVPKGGNFNHANNYQACNCQRNNFNMCHCSRNMNYNNYNNRN